ncbi:MAG: hypothetical protein CM1200mP16_01210 [Nitrospina sp.]|nr:MAG: hypothetical protein CM1200mP16_01210 [Nitrospina sp.]
MPIDETPVKEKRRKQPAKIVVPKSFKKLEEKGSFEIDPKRLFRPEILKTC